MDKKVLVCKYIYIYTTAYMDFEDIMLSEITGQRDTNGYITYMQNLENNNTNSQEKSGFVVTISEVWGEGHVDKRSKCTNFRL